MLSPSPSPSKATTSPATFVSLDLFSTSQTCDVVFSSNRCVNNAPFFAYNLDESRTWALAQGNCHSWTCPRCSASRAKQEYGRIVAGAEELDVDHDLYFITLTTKGSGTPVKTAVKNYYTWTNRLLTALRKDAKKRGLPWHYAQVTEWQKRGHPHSHLITTYHPDDLRPGTRKKWSTNAQGKRVVERKPVLLSDYLQQRCVTAGLGHIYDISEVDSAAGASRYVSKYLFKDTMFSDLYPKHWKRVRYSRDYPKLPEYESEAMAILKPKDWNKLFQVAAFIQPRDDEALGALIARSSGVDIVVDLRHINNAKSPENGYQEEIAPLEGTIT